MEISFARTDEELERIFRFRYSIYVEEMRKPIARADHVRKIFRDDLDDTATHICVTHQSELAGVLRINWGRLNGVPPHFRERYALHRFEDFPLSVLSFTSRMMIAPQFRKSRVAVTLAIEAYNLGCKNGIEFDFIHTEPALVPFFLRLGHRPYKDDFTDPDLGKRTPLVLVLRDRDYLRACSSPFTKCSDGYTLSAGAAAWISSAFPGPRGLATQ